MSKEKITLVVDSSCGLTKKEVEKMGYTYVPIDVTLDGVDYADGDTLTEDELIVKLNPHSVVKTAAVSPGVFAEAYKKALEKAEKVVCITLSSKLSSVNNNAKMAADLEDNFKDKVVVPNSYYIGPWFKSDLLKIDKLIKKGTTVEKILEIIETTNQTARGAFCPDSLIYLKNGGRVSGASAAIGNALKILPIVPWEYGEMPNDKISKARTFKKAAKSTIDYVSKEWDKVENKKDYEVFVIISGRIEKEDMDFVNQYIENVQTEFKIDYKPNNTPLGAALIAHMGPVFIGIGIRVK